MAYLNFDAIFEFLGRTIYYKIIFQTGVDINFEIEHKTCFVCVCVCVCVCVLFLFCFVLIVCFLFLFVFVLFCFVFVFARGEVPP